LPSEYLLSLRSYVGSVDIFPHFWTEDIQTQQQQQQQHNKQNTTKYFEA
jgi:hypothetical protein